MVKLLGATYTGEYTGDGENSQDIECGFSPSRVKIYDDSGNYAELINSKTYAYREVLVSGEYVLKRYELISAIVIIDNGFIVQNAYLNIDSKKYYWEVC